MTTTEKTGEEKSEGGRKAREIEKKKKRRRAQAKSHTITNELAAFSHC